MPSLILEFTKMQAAGNDFLVLDDRWYRFSEEELSGLAARWCPRRTGVGADGLLALAPPTTEGAHYRMRYYNADGSHATMCGNGARCLARYARGAGFDAAELVFDTDAGRYRAHLPADADDPTVRLFVPDPQDWRPNRPLERPLPEPLKAVHYVWTGTEHLVAFVDDLDGADVAAWGRALRTDPALAPAGANANFVTTASDADAVDLRMRTYEKGVEAETLSCGTGVLAAAAVARHLNRAPSDRPVRIRTRGGLQTVGTASTSDGESHLFLEGPAQVVFRGTLEVGKNA